MQIYFAAPTGKRRDILLKEYGDKYGACQTRDVFSTPHLFNKWFFDNGAFSDWKKNKKFNTLKYFNRIEQIESMITQNSVTRPQFIVIPDQVAGGVGSKKMYVWAKLCGFDSVDSGLPMIHSKHLQSALNIEETYSQNLFLRAA